MTIDLTTRNLLISLCSHMAYMQGQLEALHQLDDPDGHYWYRESVALRQKAADHLAALADEPAVPQGREPAAVTGQPSDEEIMGLMPQQMHEDLAYAARAMANEAGTDNRKAKGFMRIALNRHAVDLARAVLARWGNPAPPPAAVTGRPSNEELLKLAQQYSVVYLLSNGSACHPFQEGYDMRNDVLNFARAVLARRGHQPAPPAAGEVAELVAWLEEEADDYACIGNTDAASKCNRAVELLQRQVPVPVSERLPGPEDCDSHGWCWVLYGAHSTWTLEPPCGQDGMPAGWTHWLPAHALPLPEVGE